MPPIISHIDLSVGFPVKKRENEEPNEFDSLTPKTIRTIPAAKIAQPIALFIRSLVFSVIFRANSCEPPRPNGREAPNRVEGAGGILGSLSAKIQPTTLQKYPGLSTDSYSSARPPAKRVPHYRQPPQRTWFCPTPCSNRSLLYRPWLQIPLCSLQMGRLTSCKLH